MTFGNQILFVRLDEEDVFPPVLNGLVATQLAEKYKHPTIVARLNDDGMIKGSIRGVSNSEFNNFRSYLMIRDYLNSFKATSLRRVVQYRKRIFGNSMSLRIKT